MKQIIRLQESELKRIVTESVKRILKEATIDNVGFQVSVDEDIFTPQEVNNITSIAKKYGVEYDGMGSYYVYNVQAFKKFVREIKQLGIGKVVYLYKGVAPDFDWSPIGQEMI